MVLYSESKNPLFFYFKHCSNIQLISLIIAVCSFSCINLSSLFTTKIILTTFTPLTNFWVYQRCFGPIQPLSPPPNTCIFFYYFHYFGNFMNLGQGYVCCFSYLLGLAIGMIGLCLETHELTSFTTLATLWIWESGYIIKLTTFTTLAFSPSTK